MSDDISFQTWICPACCDDHSPSSGCYREIAKKDARIKELIKENKYLRASLNRLYGEVSNGEHLDKEWIKEALLSEAHSQVLDALNSKMSKNNIRIKELEEREKKLVELLQERLKQDDHIDGCGYAYDPDNYPCHCMDKSYYNHDAWTDRVVETLKELGINNE